MFENLVKHQKQKISDKLWKRSNIFYYQYSNNAIFGEIN